MKRYFINNYKITKLNKYFKKCYNANFLITINGDILGYANNLKQAIDYIKAL